MKSSTAETLVVFDLVQGRVIANHDTKGIPSADPPSSTQTRLHHLDAAVERGEETSANGQLGSTAANEPPMVALEAQSKTLRLSRDHIGSNSLYWRMIGDKVFFGSKLREVVQAGPNRPSLNEQSVATFLAEPNRPPWQGTFFEGVHAVPPGCIVHLAPDRSVRTTRWWDPVAAPTTMYPDPRDYSAAARELIEVAIRQHLEGAKRVGAHISGGIDSTGVSTIAASQLRERESRLAGAYTWSPAITETYPLIAAKDERSRVKLAARDTPLRFGEANEHNLVTFIERPMEYEGVADLADEIPMLELAARDGIDVMLSGWGGDEAFSAHGLGYLAHLLITLQLPRASRFARSQLRTLRKLGPLASLLWDQGIYPLLPKPLYNHLSPYLNLYPTMCFISLGLKQLYKREIAERRQPIKFGPSIGENIKRHLFYGHIGMRMETWSAWARSYGFEYRYPLTDRRLLEFLMSIPPEVLFMNDQPRGLALAAFRDVLPPNVMKYDYANERFRENTRYNAWVLIAEKVRRGEWLHQDCAWLDMKALRACAVSPKAQSVSANVLEFAELFTALRVWHMHRRHNPSN